MHDLFYVPLQNISAGGVRFPKAELRHLRTVMRVREGERVWVTDGVGNRMRVSLTDLSAGLGKILESEKEEPGVGRRVTMALPILRGERMDWAVEKLTELGIGKVQPFRTRFSVARLEKRDRWRRVSIAAMKQSLGCYLPELKELVGFDDLCSAMKSYSAVLVASRDGMGFDSDELLNGPAKGEELMGLVGPEGGFSEEELSRLAELGCVGVSFGDRRLRSETAAVLMAGYLVRKLGGGAPGEARAGRP